MWQDEDSRLFQTVLFYHHHPCVIDISEHRFYTAADMAHKVQITLRNSAESSVEQIIEKYTELKTWIPYFTDPLATILVGCLTLSFLLSVGWFRIDKTIYRQVSFLSHWNSHHGDNYTGNTMVHRSKDFHYNSDGFIRLFEQNDRRSER